MSSARHEQVTSLSIGMFWCGEETSRLTYLEMTPARASQMSPRGWVHLPGDDTCSCLADVTSTPDNQSLITNNQQ